MQETRINIYKYIIKNINNRISSATFVNDNFFSFITFFFLVLNVQKIQFVSTRLRKRLNYPLSVDNEKRIRIPRQRWFKTVKVVVPSSNYFYCEVKTPVFFYNSFFVCFLLRLTNCDIFLNLLQWTIS